MRIVIMFPLVAAASLAGGCLAWVVPEYAPPAPMVDGGSPFDLAPAAAASDAATSAPAEGGVGGAAAPLTFADVQTGLDAKGCTGGACHGGLQSPVLKATPASDADRMANYTAFKSGCAQGKCIDMTTPEASLMLKKPLAESGLTHVGGKLFADFNDAVYLKWLAWIKAGAPY
ncbi:MAG: hypothetical protein JWN44_5486 [Myxococcales bacterium]|nr:hypothetical protein [Myxococcales bacterium]